MTTNEELAVLRKRIEVLEQGFLGVSASLERMTLILEHLQTFKNEAMPVLVGVVNRWRDL